MYVSLQISSEFCMWLRNRLPAGEDATVNSLPQEYVRALFDTAQSANVAHSKIAQGLQGQRKYRIEMEYKRFRLECGGALQRAS